MEKPIIANLCPVKGKAVRELTIELDDSILDAPHVALQHCASLANLRDVLRQSVCVNIVLSEKNVSPPW